MKALSLKTPSDTIEVTAEGAPTNQTGGILFMRFGWTIWYLYYINFVLYKLFIKHLNFIEL